jgi:hypothetical protein
MRPDDELAFCARAPAVEIIEIDKASRIELENFVMAEFP